MQPCFLRFYGIGTDFQLILEINVSGHQFFIDVQEAQVVALAPPCAPRYSDVLSIADNRWAVGADRVREHAPWLDRPLQERIATQISRLCPDAISSGHNNSPIRLVMPAIKSIIESSGTAIPPEVAIHTRVIAGTAAINRLESAREQLVSTVNPRVPACEYETIGACHPYRGRALDDAA